MVFWYLEKTSLHHSQGPMYENRIINNKKISILFFYITWVKLSFFCVKVFPKKGSSIWIAMQGLQKWPFLSDRCSHRSRAFIKINISLKLFSLFFFVNSPLLLNCIQYLSTTIFFSFLHSVLSLCKKYLVYTTKSKLMHIVYQHALWEIRPLSQWISSKSFVRVLCIQSKKFRIKIFPF